MVWLPKTKLPVTSKKWAVKGRCALVFDVSPGHMSPVQMHGPVPAGGVPVSPVTVPDGAVFMSDEWRRLFLHTVREAARLGLKIGLNLGSGWNCGGPWITPDHASAPAGLE